MPCRVVIQDRLQGRLHRDSDRVSSKHLLFGEIVTGSKVMYEKFGDKFLAHFVSKGFLATYCSQDLAEQYHQKLQVSFFSVNIMDELNMDDKVNDFLNLLNQLILYSDLMKKTIFEVYFHPKL